MGLAMSLNLDIDSLPPEQVEAAITRLEMMKAQRAAKNKLAHYRPYPKQVAFHAAGARCRERLLIAVNLSGKSLAGAMECAMHATGRYPHWWKGRFAQRQSTAQFGSSIPVASVRARAFPLASASPNTSQQAPRWTLPARR
jgi:hypothetical protein